VVTGQGADQRAVGSLSESVRHRGVLQGHRSNGGDVACEEAEQQTGTKGGDDSYFGVGDADGASAVKGLKTVTVVGGALTLAGG
jgi:hypothetical protein